MRLFKKRDGENVYVEIKIITKVPYPDETTRVEKFSKPLRALFSYYFDNIAIGYNKKKGNLLDSIYVVAYDAKFSYKMEEKYLFLKNIFFILRQPIIELFNIYNIKIKIVGCAESSFSNIEDFLKAKAEKTGLNLKWFVRESVDFLIFESKKRGEALFNAKKFLTKISEKGTKNVRLNPRYPNIVEIFDKQKKKWITLAYFSDPEHPYLERLTSS
ncbi:MAG: hypothetical protein QW484_01615 [Candidatus Pacearchaeota archaeon]